MRYFAISSNDLRSLGYSNTLMTILLGLSGWAFGITTALWIQAAPAQRGTILNDDPVALGAAVAAGFLFIAALATLIFRETVIHEIVSSTVDIHPTVATGGQSGSGIQGSG